MSVLKGDRIDYQKDGTLLVLEGIDAGIMCDRAQSSGGSDYACYGMKINRSQWGKGSR